MGRSPCCSDDANTKKGPWTPEEDQKLMDYINKHGHGNWRTLSKHAALNRCGKSCRLRWANYLRPDIKRGKFSDEEEKVIINLHSVLGNKWSKIATHLPGRTDNEIKNYWNTQIRKKLLNMGIDPNTHKPRTDLNHVLNLSQMIRAAQMGNLMNPWDGAAELAKFQLLQTLMQIMNANKFSNLSSDLMGSQNFSYPIEGPVNGISSVHANQPVSNFRIDNSGEFNYEIPGMISSDKSLSSSCNSQIENSFPRLELESSGTSCMNQMENKKIDLSSTVSQAWEKLMDDETNDSYWKDILDLTSMPSSPIDW